MFNLGFMEIVVIGVLALIFIGPKQLPEMARVLGRMINEFKKATSELQGGLLDIKNELKEPLKDGLDALSKLQNDVRSVNVEDIVQKYVSPDAKDEGPNHNTKRVPPEDVAATEPGDVHEDEHHNDDDHHDPKKA